MKTWITADWHLGESRFEIMERPFSSIDEHNDYLITQHNNWVEPEDTVIVVGDVCYQKAPEYLQLVSKFAGKKVLIRGNHDRVFTDEQLNPYFDTIIEEGKGIEMDVNGIPCYLTHYPSEGKIDRFNLVGHIHGAFKYQLNSLNVGVDVHHFRPVNIDSIPFHLTAITKFYDMDVWAAYTKINFSHLKTRGKKDTYFRPKK